MSDRAALKKELNDIDREMIKLSLKRVDVVNKMHHLATVTAMREAGEFSLKRLELEFPGVSKGDIDHMKACCFMNTTVLPWRHILGRNFFPNAMDAIPEYGPSRFSKQEAIESLTRVSEAIKKDLAALK